MYVSHRHSIRYVVVIIEVHADHAFFIVKIEHDGEPTIGVARLTRDGAIECIHAYEL